MSRRQFVSAAFGLSAAVAAPWFAQAQETPVELQDYIRLSKPVPVELPPGKRIEVVEFFWYECPHCNALEPLLQAWADGLPADVLLRRVPVGFSPHHEVTQRLFYALQVMGQLESGAALHTKVFDAIHNSAWPPGSERQWGEFVANHGIDRTRFSEVFRSAEVTALVRKANQWQDAAEVEGVPTLVVQGRFSTSPARAGNRQRALAVADHLIRLARQA